MSTQTPLQPEPTACSTNWYTRWACKFQTIIEPLCEKQSDFALNAYEQNRVLFELSKTCRESFHIAVGLYGTTRAINSAIIRWQKRNNQTIVLSPEAQAILAPRLTVWNKLGLSVWKAFSVGTACSCCLSYRLMLLILFSGLVGYWIK